MGGEFLSFDEALAELQMATHELRSMVAQGEIRAFRDEDVLKFRRTDVLDFKKSRQTQPGELVIEPKDIGDEEPTLVQAGPPAEEKTPGAPVQPAKHETEETELLTGVGKEQSTTDFLGLDDTAAESIGSDTAQTVVPTIEISDEDVIDDTAQTVIPTVSADEETSVFSGTDDAVPPTAPSLLAEEDEATEMATQEIRPDEVAPTAPAALVEDDSIAETEGVATVVEEPTAVEGRLTFADEADAATAAAAGELGITTDEVGAGVTAPRRSQKYLAQAAAVKPSPFFLALAILTFVILLLSVPIFYNLATDSTPTLGPYKNLVEFLGKQARGTK